MCKFRTMRPPKRGEVWYMTDEQRISRLGRILRATSRDELLSCGMYSAAR